jgi:anti-sigma regulatory factor (Ser/Thr protein kinase)
MDPARPGPDMQASNGMDPARPGPDRAAATAGLDARLWQGICQAAGQLVQETDLTQALQGILAHACHALSLDRVGVFARDAETGDLLRIAAINDHGEFEEGGVERISLDRAEGGPLRQVARGELTYFHSHDVRLDVPDVRFAEDIRALAIVPLVAGGQLIGAMSVDNLPSGRDIEETVLQPLVLFGHFAAIALHNEARQRELLQAETAKKAFYRDVVYSATNGKLVLCNREEIDGYWLAPLEELAIRDEGDIREVRRLVRDACEAAGMEEQRIYDLGLCASEAATNALKHGDGGRAAIARVEDRIRVRIEDNGCGIDPVALPRATLMKGFSTRASMGLGFTIMHELADKIYLHTGAGGTVVILEMGIRAPAMPELPLALLTWEE